MKPSVGILKMDNRVPRIPGDIGNTTTFAFPVAYRTVAGSTNARVVLERDRSLLAPYIEEARELERTGARSITTTCGFLAMFQTELAAAVRIPVFTSSLLLVPLVYRMIGPARRVGIITAVSDALDETHFNASGWSAKDIPIALSGMQARRGFRALIDDLPEIDADLIGQEMEDTARALVRDHPDVGAIVLECANMAPYAHLVQRAVGLPVFDVQLLTNLMHEATHRVPYAGPS